MVGVLSSNPGKGWQLNKNRISSFLHVVIKNNGEEDVSNLSALPRAKRDGEEEGQKLDPIELRRSHYGRMKSRIGRHVGSRNEDTKNLQQLLHHHIAGNIVILKYCNKKEIQILNGQKETVH